MMKEIVLAAVATSHMIGGVPLYDQFPNFPTGCEVVSATMMLHYWGLNADINDLVENHLDEGSLEFKDGQVYAPHPAEAFVGDPRLPNSYGCYSDAIEEMLWSCLKGVPESEIRIETGNEMNELTVQEICERYIINDIPVMVWNKIPGTELCETDTWMDLDGIKFTWIANEHCVLLVGFDSEHYIYHDPYTGECRSMEKEEFEEAYDFLGGQYIAICTGEKMDKLIMQDVIKKEIELMEQQGPLKVEPSGKLKQAIELLNEVTKILNELNNYEVLENDSI